LIFKSLFVFLFVSSLIKTARFREEAAVALELKEERKIMATAAVRQIKELS
jgi:hypothetical protein